MCESYWSSTDSQMEDKHSVRMELYTVGRQRMRCRPNGVLVGRPTFSHRILTSDHLALYQYHNATII